jgi:centrosomal protein CEP104
MYNGSEDRFGPKLNMYVCYCSGEDPSFPVSSLARHTRKTCGWQSPKLCEYPQELGFRFEGEVELQSLRVLIHESKVPSRIEVFIADATEEERNSAAPSVTYDRAVFRRLGHVLFGTNEENNFESRELKTVSIRRSCLYLKLIIRKAHPNPINLFGQVGVIAISPHGHVMRPFPAFLNGGGGVSYAAIGEQDDVPLEEMTAEARDAANQEDDDAQEIPEGCEGLDAQTIRQVRDLLNHKNRAVQAEDYDLAKALKTQIELLKGAGSRIAELEDEKKRAVASEDYDRAKQLKLEIDHLRSNAQGPSSQPPLMAQQQHYQQQPPQVFAQHGGGSYNAAPQSFGQTAAPADVAPLQPQTWNDPSPTAGRSNSTHDMHPSGGVMSSNGPMMDYNNNGPFQGGLRGGNNAAPTATSFDERPAVAGGAQNIDDIVAEGGTGGIVAKAPASAPSSSQTQATSGNGISEWEESLNKLIVRNSDDQPRAEVLTGAKAQDSKTAQGAFGIYAAACLFSKRFQLREAAVKTISSSNGFALLPSKSGAIDALVQYAGHKGYGINDSVAAVFFAVCDGLSAILTGSLKGSPPPSSIGGSFMALLPDLMLKAGDNNARVREVAATVLTQIASSDLGPERVSSAALAEPENSTKKPLNHRVHVARIHIVQLLLQDVGLNRKDARTGLTSEAIMTRLVLPSLQHSHQDVREGALALLVELYRMAPSISKYFTDLKPAQKSLIDERIGQSGSAQSPSPQKKGRAQISREDEPEMVSSSFTVDKGGTNEVLNAARQVRDAKAKGTAEKPAPKAAGKVPAAKAAATPPPAEDPSTKTCQFCERYDKRFDEQSFQLHYLRTCPMLCPCPLCGQVTEISYLQTHIVSECDHRTLVRQCPLCKEAVRAEDLDDHVAAKQCIAASKQYNVCPLCHEKLTPAGDKGWKLHLLKSPGCVNNPRQFDGGAGEEFQE